MDLRMSCEYRAGLVLNEKYQDWHCYHLHPSFSTSSSQVLWPQFRDDLHRVSHLHWRIHSTLQSHFCRLGGQCGHHERLLHHLLDVSINNSKVFITHSKSLGVYWMQFVKTRRSLFFLQTSTRLANFLDIDRCQMLPLSRWIYAKVVFKKKWLTFGPSRFSRPILSLS